LGLALPPHVNAIQAAGRESLLTSNLRLVDAPGNVLVPAKAAGLPKDSVANVSQIITIDRDFLAEPVGTLRGQLLRSIDDGLRLVLGL
jgi:mRNA interferase MazF